MKLPKEFLPENLDAMEVFPPKEIVSLRDRLAKMSSRARDVADTVLSALDERAYQIEKVTKILMMSTLVTGVEVATLDHMAKVGYSPEAVLFALGTLAVGIITAPYLASSEVKSLADIRGKKIKL